jgi:hypothetical protein
MDNYIIFLFGVSFGTLLSYLVVYINSKIWKSKNRKEYNRVYRDVYSRLEDFEFKWRMNSLVLFEVSGTINGDIELSLDLSSRKMGISKKGGEVIWTTYFLDAELKDIIIDAIIVRWWSEIDNTQNLNGVIVDNKTYSHIISSDGYIEGENNSNNFNLDVILDKINKFGIDKLTKEEKNFLDNYE